MARQMKDSGVEWIGKIPSTWSIRRNKTLFDCSKEIVGDASNNTQLLSLTTQGVKTKRQDTFGGKVPESFDTYQLVETDDIVMCLFDLDCSAVFSGISPFNGMISPAYKVLKCKYEMLPKFADYWFRFVFDGRKFKTYAKNLRYTLNYDEFATLPIVFPSFEEQSRIVYCLDQKCKEIESVIASTKCSIEEYKLLRQSIITEAVTKGVHGNHAIVESGLEWIPEIAADWAISRVGLHYNIVLGKMLCDKQLKDDYSLEEYLCAANVHFEGVETSNLKKMWFSPTEKETYAVKTGDLVVVEGGAGAGGASIVTQLNSPIYVQNSVMIVRNKSGNDNRYLRYWIECLVKKGYISVVCNKATIPHFTKDKLASMPVPVLSLTEQAEISDYLDGKCAEIDALIAAKEKLLTELESYKKSVIYEYVTGKKEVPACQ